MRSSAVVSLLVIALTAAAFWADGASAGELIVGPALVGFAAFFHARTVERGLLQIAIGLVYLASIALGSVGASLINKAVGSTAPDELLNVGSVISGLTMGWAVCTIFLERKPAPIKG